AAGAPGIPQPAARRGDPARRRGGQVARPAARRQGMKRFVFRLERVLGIRRFELERARRALAEVENEAIRRATLLAEAERRLEQGRRQLDEDSAAGADGALLALRARAVRSG